MYKFIVSIIVFIIFTGCAEKINPNEFHPIITQKAPIQPTPREVRYKPNVIIFTKEKNYYQQKAKEALANLLLNSKYVNILDRKSNIKDEIKLAENAKAANSDLNQADFIIITDITPKTYDTKYTPPKYYQDKKGKIHKIPGYYSYEACSSGYINIYNVLPYQLVSSIYTNGCFYTTTPNYQNIKNYILLKSIYQAIENAKYNLYKVFTPKGYIFEIRKKDDEIILHTTLGRANGAKEYEGVYIYEKKVKTMPFSNKKIIEEVKIGEGIISNIVNENDSWIIVKKYKQMPKIGDYVKMNYKYSFWDIFK